MVGVIEEFDGTMFLVVVCSWFSIYRKKLYIKCVFDGW